MTNTYLAGNLIRVSAAFANASGQAADPTTVILKYRPGRDAAIVSATYPAAPIVKDATGNYHADLDTTSSTPGVSPWTYEWSGTGTIQALNTSLFNVEQPAI